MLSFTRSCGRGWGWNWARGGGRSRSRGCGGLCLDVFRADIGVEIGSWILGHVSEVDDLVVGPVEVRG